MKRKPLCVIVDDERSAIARLKDCIEELDLLEIEDSFINPDKFIVAIENLSAQIFFLDIDMPIKGTEVAKHLENKKVIFVSAHQEEAYFAFKVNAIDFVKKPIQLSELKTAINKVLKEVNQYLVVGTQEASLEEITLDSIVLITSNKDDSRNKDIFLYSGKSVVAKNIRFDEIISQLNSNFIQIHRSHIINYKYANKMLSKDLIGLEYANGSESITLGNNYRDAFFDAKPRFR
jgi:DNA-binding LytR/AlgR family response regulator